MRLIKFLTRKYSLLEHYIIAASLLKETTSIKQIYYLVVHDISRKGLIDIYVSKEDLENNQKRVIVAVKNDKNYPRKMLDNGLKATENLAKLPKNLIKRVSKLSDKEIIKEFLVLKKKIFDYSGYFDLTHYLGSEKIKLDKEVLKKLSKFHDYRKVVFMNYFKFLDKVCRAIARKKEVKSGNINFLTLNEIIKLLQGKLTSKQADILQKKRKQHYILTIKSGKEKIITDNFEKEFNKTKKYILEEKQKETKGLAINRGIIRGEVKLITQKTPLNKIPSGKIIVTQMTNPDMTPILKKSKAIITDEGGLLCHAANITREFGIIAIIGTKNATSVLKDGDLVEVDATKGIVKILKH